ncbi:MAG TPA: fatty acid desaturase [Gammaproteobacteria bacterium]
MINDLLNGLLNAPVWAIVLYTVIVTHVTITGVTLYLHRDATHRGLDLHPVVRHFFRFWLWMTTAMLTKDWVAVHRKHHAKCETEEDPHSPQVLGLKKVLLEGAELYRVEANNPETLEKFGRGTPNDWIERNVYSRYPILGVSILMVINLVLFGALGLTVWAIQMMAIPLLAAGVINGIGHYFGYRNFECKDAATNVMPWGVIMGGEELHNNHHAYPSSAKFALRRGEFDVGWFYIRILGALGLAKVRRVAPKPSVDVERGHLDLDTVKAIIVARLHVLRDYASHVTLPTMKTELVQAGGKARALLVREVTLLDDSAKQRLHAMLDQSDKLKTVHEFRERLQKLWESSTLSNEKLVESFKQWCEEAEKSGIEVLERFAQRLRGYQLQPMPA